MGLLHHRRQSNATITRHASRPELLGQLPEGMFADVKDLLSPNSQETAVFDSKLEFIGYEKSQPVAEKLAKITLPGLQCILDQPGVHPEMRWTTYYRIRAVRAVTASGSQRVLQDSNVLPWHTDGLSALASDELPSTYAVGIGEFPARLAKLPIGQLLRQYEIENPNEEGFSLPPGMTTFVAPSREITLQGAGNPHRSSANQTGQDIDSVLLGFLPEFLKR